MFSRPFHRKDDSEAIEAWRLDLDRIRRVLEVRSLEDSRNAVKTDATVSGVQHGSVHHHPTFSNKPADDQTVASDVHHRISKSQEDSSSRHRAVSISLTCSSQSSDS